MLSVTKYDSLGHFVIQSESAGRVLKRYLHII